MPRRSFTTQVEQAVQDRVRSTVAGMQRQGFPELTLAQFVEDASGSTPRRSSRSTTAASRGRSTLI